MSNVIPFPRAKAAHDSHANLVVRLINALGVTPVHQRQALVGGFEKAARELAEREEDREL